MFIVRCDVAARDLPMPYGDVVIGLAALLRIKRTLGGAQINKFIIAVRAGEALLIEHGRYANWRKRELSACRFNAAPLPAHVRCGDCEI
jgi:hypothetical protein